METKFRICRHCGNLMGMINDSGVPVVCCGEPTEELVPNTSEGSGEKHIPVVKREEGKVVVNVGSVDHPMLPEHRIEWIYLHTDRGGQRKTLLPSEKPCVTFHIGDEKPLAVYAYCNLHGLWMTEIF